MSRYPSSNRALIELALTSCVQKLAFLRGDGTSPRTFPADEREVIEAFGIECIRLALNRSASSGTYAFTEDGDFEPSPLDEDAPGARSRLRREK